jgi:hypothetical protein
MRPVGGSVSDDMEAIYEKDMVVSLSFATPLPGGSARKRRSR